MNLLETDWRPVTAFLDSAVAGGAAPGAVLGVSVAGNRFLYATGTLGQNEAARPAPTTVYDLASLTKVVGLATAVMLAVDDAKLDLDAPVQRYVPTFVGEGKERVTIRMLLAHASGLPAWRPLYREVTTRSEAYALVDSTPLGTAPGSVTVYSDLGAILLTQVVETVYHERIDSLLERRVFQPLGLRSLQYLPPGSARDRIAPTELDPRRGRILRGEVHDENAALMDGVSGHAGLFGSADDVLTFAEWLLAQADHPSIPPTLPPSVIREFSRRQDLVPGSSRALGWDTPSPESSAGIRLSSRSFGHTGFTGTSLWIDPDRQLAIVLLSNRVNPTRENLRWTPVRARLADLVMTTLFEDAR
ncbi:MAG TPA: serine hydrolase domain-containing protein [Gemmatimonadales bacterium]|nr:serine hydrolase domain-containing protein [Gemmatimonadales bacterium]